MQKIEHNEGHIFNDIFKDVLEKWKESPIGDISKPDTYCMLKLELEKFWESMKTIGGEPKKQRDILLRISALGLKAIHSLHRDLYLDNALKVYNEEKKENGKQI